MSDPFLSCSERSRIAVRKLMEEIELIVPCEKRATNSLQNSLTYLMHAIVEQDINGAVSMMGLLLDSVLRIFGKELPMQNIMVAFDHLGLALEGNVDVAKMYATCELLSDSLTPKYNLLEPTKDQIIGGLHSALIHLLDKDPCSIDKEFVSLFPLLLLKFVRETKKPLHICAGAAALSISSAVERPFKIADNPVTSFENFCYEIK